MREFASGALFNLWVRQRADRRDAKSRRRLTRAGPFELRVNKPRLYRDGAKIALRTERVWRMLRAEKERARRAVPLREFRDSPRIKNACKKRR